MVSTIRCFNTDLFCPICKGNILYKEDLIICHSCSTKFLQETQEYINLLPQNAIIKEESKWEERQEDMELWYKNLITDTISAVSVFEHDYTPLKLYFAQLTGNILDLGGGVGVVRHYLSDKSNYIVVDPSADWLSSDWKLLSNAYPCLNTKPNFVMGVGEFLMFADNTFDSVLSLWSINHVSNPAKVFHEVQRVLKRGGRFFIVFEDMEPLWRDFLDKSLLKYFGLNGLTRMLKSKIRTALFNQKWPVQSDHIFITDKDIQQWSNSRFNQIQRKWIGTYLTYEFVKK
ncbi:class I SAM-dependent methyltransferase [Adhaeribacter radiodurans]|uniref:Class I SAM-dependent methyltransferase n=1 Tax=Adhaeribacter radiodurans TaxID=2745197 RepID=A0A7L7L3R6_9BACT|nr:class I SAM-dependent methyltransferase [Adhaeribacter radiodurans]QMU27447.1 class I SAM-dependent methyltransferase [Adhaeribacter radiodurans]